MVTASLPVTHALRPAGLLQAQRPGRAQGTCAADGAAAARPEVQSGGGAGAHVARELRSSAGRVSAGPVCSLVLVRGLEGTVTT